MTEPAKPWAMAASLDDDAIFRHVVDALRLFVRLNLPRTPVEVDHVASLYVSALMQTASDILADFDADVRPSAIEHAQDFLARCVATQVEMNRKARASEN